MNHSKYPDPAILIIDDEVAALHGMETLLRAQGLNNVLCHADPRALIPELAHRGASAVLLDLGLPHVSGEELLTSVSREFPEVPVIIVTGVDTVETAVQCMRKGAFDFLVKPVEPDRLLASVRHAVGLSALQQENRHLRHRMLSQTLEHPELFEEIVTRSASMLAIFQYVEAIARGPHPVLITGETGTGKELVAQAIHRASARSGPFVPVNVAGLDDQLFADALFGHVKGGFTGADQPREGLVAKASGGTLFLDEIGDLSAASQVKLLRLVQESEYSPIGSDAARRADARIIVASNHDLRRDQLTGGFRRDLYYRLSAHEIAVPPLRNRREDIPLLVEHFLALFSRELGKQKPTVPPELAALLANYQFPGNVRELKSMMLDAVTRQRHGKISREAIVQKMAPEGLTEDRAAAMQSGPQLLFPEVLPTLKQAARSLVAEAMRRADGNQSVAARLLGITQQALSKRLKGKGTSVPRP
ncbi:MAG: sigma-54 dependent transcriptional regulator [Acidobacteriota bacterium]